MFLGFDLELGGVTCNFLLLFHQLQTTLDVRKQDVRIPHSACVLLAASRTQQVTTSGTMICSMLNDHVKCLAAIILKENKSTNGRVALLVYVLCVAQYMYISEHCPGLLVIASPKMSTKSQKNEGCSKH